MDRIKNTYLPTACPPPNSFESQEETECLLDDDDLAGDVNPEEVS